MPGWHEGRDSWPARASDMGPVIAIQRMRQKDRTVKVFWTTLPPFYIIHYQVNQNFGGTRQDITRNAAQPDAGVHNVPDQFRIIAASEGGGMNGITSHFFATPEMRLLPLIQAEA